MMIKMPSEYIVFHAEEDDCPSVCGNVWTSRTGAAAVEESG